MKRLIVLLIIFSCFYACKKDNKVTSDVAKVDIDFTVERFDRIFAESTPKDLTKLKQAYPFLFSDRYPDSLWVNRMTDTLQQKLYAETNDVFSDFKLEKAEINQLFQHLKYYFPEFKTPRVITVVSNVDYRNKAIVTDSIVLISLDTYLGADHEFYEGIQNYIKQNFRASQITPDLATEYAKKYSYQVSKKTLLDEMIYFGRCCFTK